MASVLPRVMGDAGPREPVPVLAVTPTGEPTIFFPIARYLLAINMSASGNGIAAGPVQGDDYLWRVTSSTWNGATATLQYLDLDGTTWSNVKDSANADVTLSANGSKPIGIAQGAIVRVSVTGADPSNLNSEIAGLGQ